MQTNPSSTDPPPRNNYTKTFSFPAVELFQLATNMDVTKTSDITGQW